MRRPIPRWLPALALLAAAAGRGVADEGRELVLEASGLGCPLVGGLG